MKRITLEIEDETFRALRSALYVRQLSGNMGGLPDAFVLAVVNAIEDGVEVKQLVQKARHD